MAPALGLERHDHLRDGQRAREALHGHRVQDRPLPRGPRPRRRRVEHRRICPKDEPRGALQAGRQGLRGLRGQVRRARATDEVKAAAGDRGKVVDLAEFVDAAEIDPVFFEKTYYVGSRDDEDAYRLLLEALEQDRPRRDRALHLPRPRVPGRGPRPRRRDRPAHAALPRRGRRRGDELEIDRPGRKPSGQPRWRWPPSSSTRSPRSFDPERLRGHLPRGGARPDQAQGQGRGDRPRRAGGARARRRPDRPRSRRACRERR